MNNTLIQLGKDYRLIQQENTEKQILNLIDSGIELISIEDMQNKLSEIGKKLKELREKYFCIVTKRKIKYILSF